MNLTAETMAALIAAELERHGISQAEFCRRVGVTPKHLNTVLNGKATARHQALDYWAFMLGCRFVVKLVERPRGPTRVGAGESPFAVRRSASRQEGAETAPPHRPVPDVIECWLCPSPTVGDSDYCAEHKGVRA